MKEYAESIVDIWRRSRWWKLVVPAAFIIGWPLGLAFQLAIVSLIWVVYAATVDLMGDRK